MTSKVFANVSLTTLCCLRLEVGLSAMGVKLPVEDRDSRLDFQRGGAIIVQMSVRGRELNIHSTTLMLSMTE